MITHLFCNGLFLWYDGHARVPVSKRTQCAKTALHEASFKRHWGWKKPGMGRFDLQQNVSSEAGVNQSILL